MDAILLQRSTMYQQYIVVVETCTTENNSLNLHDSNNNVMVATSIVAKNRNK